MAFTIDSTTYPKAKTYPIGHGYATRPYQPTKIVVHSTEGGIGQSLETSAKYLYSSSSVSADFLNGRGGEIIQFLDSAVYQAWHAGGLQVDGSWTAQPSYSNPHSIGIENLHTDGEDWPAVQLQSLEWLLEYLMRRYNIPAASIETHGQIAIAGPYDRRHDPTNWPHADFIKWRDTQLQAIPAYPIYRIIAPCAVLTARSPSAALATGPSEGQTRLAPGDLVYMGQQQDGYLWISDDLEHVPGIGFIPSSYAVPRRGAL